MNSKKINIGVIGSGHLGQYHVKHYKNMNNINFLGLHDSNPERGNEIAKKYETKYFENVSNLMEVCDGVSIVTPTESHYDVAKIALNEFCCNVFIEKPITETILQADDLINHAQKNDLIIQVGHIERLNPALKALEKYDINPKFIDIQRLAPYTARGTDVPVVLDLMIHDIDILLSLVKSKVKSIHASGVSILTNSVDIAHARIRFENGTVSSVTASRVAKDKVRKIKIFQDNLYSTIDLLLEQTEIYNITKNSNLIENALQAEPFPGDNEKKYIVYEKPKIKNYDSLREELNNFVNSILNIESPIVNGREARNALEVVIKINEMILEDLK